MDPSPVRAWRVVLDEEQSSARDAVWRPAMEVDPRARTVWLGLRAEGSGTLDVQSGAVARSYFQETAADWRPAAVWLAGPEASALLETLAAGYHCDTLWTGDPVVRWSDAAWEAGNALYVRVGSMIAPPS